MNSYRNHYQIDWAGKRYLKVEYSVRGSHEIIRLSITMIEIYHNIEQNAHDKRFETV